MFRTNKARLGLRILLVVQGGVLLLAAVTKAHELTTVPVPSYQLWATLVLITYELALGAWCITGICTRLTWKLLLLTFSAFAIAALAKSVVGDVSCGCFGTFVVDPRLTFALDIAFVVALIYLRCGVVTMNRRRIVTRLQILAFPTVAAVLCVWGAGLTNQLRVTDLQASSPGSLVVLRPGTWVGNKFELLPHLDTTPDLAHGEWSLLFFRDGCHVCHDVMAELVTAIESGVATPTVLVGLDDTPPSPLISRLKALGCDVTSLPSQTDWFVTTPLRVSLRDGICIAADTVEHWDA